MSMRWMPPRQEVSQRAQVQRQIRDNQPIIVQQLIHSWRQRRDTICPRPLSRIRSTGSWLRIDPSYLLGETQRPREPKERGEHAEARPKPIPIDIRANRPAKLAGAFAIRDITVPLVPPGKDRVIGIGSRTVQCQQFSSPTANRLPAGTGTHNVPRWLDTHHERTSHVSHRLSTTETDTELALQSNSPESRERPRTLFVPRQPGSDTRQQNACEKNRFHAINARTMVAATVTIPPRAKRKLM
jgi:hypothetical protein